MRQGDGDREDERLELGALRADEIGADHRLAVAGGQRVECSEERSEPQRERHCSDTVVRIGDQIGEGIATRVVLARLGRRE